MIPEYSQKQPNPSPDKESKYTTVIDVYVFHYLIQRMRLFYIVEKGSCVITGSTWCDKCGSVRRLGLTDNFHSDIPKNKMHF